MKLKVRTRNTTTRRLKHEFNVPIPTVYRAGSITTNETLFGRLKDKYIVEINTVQACQNSSSKILMKKCFDEHEIISAQWAYGDDIKNFNVFPAIIKHQNSSKGNGIFYIENINQLNEFCENHNLEKYIIEKYFTYSREYRIHVSKFGGFHASRKMLRTDAEVRWHRHGINSVYILPENPLFQAPSNWNEIVEECKKALLATGLEIGAVDVKVQSKQENAKFIILETNSAPALGEISFDKYKTELKKILDEKFFQ